MNFDVKILGGREFFSCPFSWKNESRTNNLSRCNEKNIRIFYTIYNNIRVLYINILYEVCFIFIVFSYILHVSYTMSYINTLREVYFIFIVFIYILYVLCLL